MSSEVANVLTIIADSPTLSAIKRKVASSERAFDFRNILPAPDFTGMNPSKIARWYRDNWGTYQNAWYCEVQEETEQMKIHYVSKMDPPEGVLERLSAMFPKADLINEYFYWEGEDYVFTDTYKAGAVIDHSRKGGKNE